MSQFNKVALIGRQGVPGVEKTLNALIDYLQSLKCSVVLEPATGNILNNDNLHIVPCNLLSKHADLLIVVGGDGSLLNAAHIAVEQNLPVLGINRGRLGFLTDIHPKELNKIEAILNGEFEEEKRFLLAAHISKDNKTIANDMGLNDVVLLPGDVAQMIEFDIFINDRLVCHQRADGMIVATPTGSTAYALSGGGPILHPKLEAVVLVPMFPHTLSSRPIVVDGDSKVTIRVSENQETPPYLSCDGLSRVAVPAGGTVTITQEARRLKLIHSLDYSYFQTLREKLNWEKHAERATDDENNQ